MASPETIPVRDEPDIVQVRQIIRAHAKQVGFTLVEQTKLVTAASELARNAVVHGGGGVCHIELVEQDGQRGLRLVFEDQGQGIADIEEAMRDGFTTASGLGLGLGGARRLVDEFQIQSQPGRGTKVTVVRWK